MSPATGWRVAIVIAASAFAMFYYASRVFHPPVESDLTNARVVNVAGDKKSIDVTTYGDAEPQHLIVESAELQGKLANVAVGDHVSIQTGEKNTLQSLTPKISMVGEPERDRALLISFLGFFLLTLFLTWGHPLQLIIGEDNRYSNSKFQAALWFWILISTYVATLWLRVRHLGPDSVHLDIPKNLLLLSGLSALTFGAAKSITTNKVQAAAAAGNQQPKPAAQHPALLHDLTHNDEDKTDFGDFQMVVVTLIAAATYLILVYRFLGALDGKAAVTLPDVDTTILATFGLGQGAYLTKKAAGEPGKA